MTDAPLSAPTSSPPRSRLDSGTRLLVDGVVAREADLRAKVEALREAATGRGLSSVQTGGALAAIQREAAELAALASAGARRVAELSQRSPMKGIR